jgi:hypothetical protein
MKQGHIFKKEGNKTNMGDSKSWKACVNIPSLATSRGLGKRDRERGT